MSYRGLLGGIACLWIACAAEPEQSGGGLAGSSGEGGAGGMMAEAGTGGTGGQPGLGGRPGGGGSGGTGPVAGQGHCETRTCAELGWACGYAIDDCGNVIDCADEGLTCSPVEVCMADAQGTTECVSGFDGTCEVCPGIPDCRSEPQPTRLEGRVVTPGRDDTDTGNQVGVPNAIVYILRSADPGDLPAMTSGIPTDGTSCARCEEQALGPVLVGAVTDASGRYALEGHIPVEQELVLVVRAGKFRRAVKYTLPSSAACQTTELPGTLPDNPTRLPRHMEDGLAVHMPRIAVTTGPIDAMECVLEKMGIAHAEFDNPGSQGEAPARVHLYRGGPDSGTPPGSGARIDDATPHDSLLYGAPDTLRRYDMVIADCEGQAWDGGFAERDAHGQHVREYVNRGGRLFASHLSFSWLHENGAEAYSDADPFETGLGPAAQWSTTIDTTNSGSGRISLGRPLASPRIEAFATWMAHEGIAPAPEHTFSIVEPRSQCTQLGDATEEFVYLEDGNGRVQQLSFATPYGAPEEAVCGRVSYSGFHVSVGGGTSPFADAVFPAHCNGDLTDQEKVLLYMLFDLGACVGEPPDPPACVPDTCDSEPDRCGRIPDGCGDVLDCGPCVIPIE